MRVTVWALPLCFAAITVVSWRYLFIIPIVFSLVITVCLTAAAWLSAHRAEAFTRVPGLSRTLGRRVAVPSGVHRFQFFFVGTFIGKMPAS